MSENLRLQPKVYRIYLEQCSYEELLELYAVEILNGACTSGVETAMVEYISRIIEPVGWKALWRATKQSTGLSVECDFLVEVFDVSLDHLQATVSSLELVECLGAEQVQESAELELLMNRILTPEICVPLVELYPVSEGDEEELFLKTAIAIEHVRCFYKYMWRPWDEDDDDDVFSEKHLSHRLKFFLDLKNKVIPESLAMQSERILQESWKLRQEIDAITQDLHVSDSEQELEEEDISRVIQLRLQLEELQKQMEIMENPFVRSLAITKDTAAKIKNSFSSNMGPVFHIVSQSFSFGRIKELDLNESDTLEFHHNPEDAIGSASSGDTILILPGVYKCGALRWLEERVTIKGLGANRHEVILEGLGGSGDFFINCNSPLLHLENVTLRPAKDATSTLMIHSGQLVMKNCAVYGGHSCAILLAKSEVEATTCDFLQAKIDGIQLRHSSSLQLNMCSVCQCNNKGIFINSALHWREAEGCTMLTLNETKISKNRDCDVVLECPSNMDSLNRSMTWDKIDKVPWLQMNINGTCELGTLGTQRMYAHESQGSPFSPPDYASFMESVDANHSHWSDELDRTVKAFNFSGDNSDDGTT